MTHPLAQFAANITQARDVLGLAAAVDAQTTGALNTNELLRAALVASVSALDHYVHEVVREGMIAIADGARPTTGAFRRFSVSVDAATRASQGTAPRVWMDEEVRRSHGHLSFQQPSKIADAVRLVWDGQLWPSVATALSSNAADEKRKIQLIVSRRNRIVHEADRDPTPPNDRWPITLQDVESAISTISATVGAIDCIIALPPARVLSADSRTGDFHVTAGTPVELRHA